MGVHTGDSITVAPAQTLTIREYQRMRDAAIAVMREIGVQTGGSNVQFAVNPIDGRMTVIEMNPRVSRSLALASKATGFPIAKTGAGEWVRLAAAATHPFADWRVQELTPGERYQEHCAGYATGGAGQPDFRAARSRGHRGSRNAIQMMNHARYFVPHLLALSSNSPFWLGMDTGLNPIAARCSTSFRGRIFPDYFPAGANTKITSSCW